MQFNDIIEYINRTIVFRFEDKDAFPEFECWRVRSYDVQSRNHAAAFEIIHDGFLSDAFSPMFRHDVNAVNYPPAKAGGLQVQAHLH